ncbi:MAG TPA: rod shape-determining protein MreD [Candidatus Methylomirabilis sp.]|nr:rod shape-determining protein MreD [Candidatus Methylomirabilis sp.]
MWPRRLLTILLAFLAGVFDATVAVWLPGNLSALRLALPLVTVLAAFSSLERVASAALVSGIILDVFLPSSAGFVTIRYAVIALAISSLSQTLFTNRSLLGSQALGLFALVCDRTLQFIFSISASAVAGSVIPEVRPALWAEAVWLATCMASVFLLFVAFTKRFLPSLSRTDVRHGGWM